MKPGTKYEVKTKDGAVEGTLVNTTKKHIFLKLSSGYNVGVAKENIEDTKKIGEVTKKEKVPSLKQNPENPRIGIFHTGGTIASKVDYATGGVSSAFEPEELLALFPELRQKAYIDSTFIANMASENLRFQHLNTIGKAVKSYIEEHEDAAGVIISMGTDMLHYAAAGLSYAFRGLQKPVIIVGAQRSSDRPSSDAAHNLLSAATYITDEHTELGGVAVCMHGDIHTNTCRIIPGTAARKMHSSRRDAFQAINDECLADINLDTYEVTHLATKNQREERLRFLPYNEDLKIGWVKAHPHMTGEELKAYDDYDAILLEGTGLGHFPTEVTDEATTPHKEIAAAIKNQAAKKPVVMTTQTIHGRIHLNVYSPGRKLREHGVLGHEVDLQPSTAYMKLAHVLSHAENPKEAYQEPLHKDISKTTKVTYYDA